MKGRGVFGSLIARGIAELIKSGKHIMRDLYYRFPPVALIKRRATELDILLEQMEILVLDAEQHVGSGKLVCIKCKGPVESSGWNQHAVQSKGSSSRPLTLMAVKRRQCKSASCKASFHDDNEEVLTKQLPPGIVLLLPSRSAKSGLPVSDVLRLLANVEAGGSFSSSERATVLDVNTSEAHRRLGHLESLIEVKRSKERLGLATDPPVSYVSVPGLYPMNAQYLQQEYLVAVFLLREQNVTLQQSLPVNVIRIDHYYKVIWYASCACATAANLMPL